MRTVKVVLVASVFATIFVGMVLISALFTSALHGQLQSRAIPAAMTMMN